MQFQSKKDEQLFYIYSIGQVLQSLLIQSQQNQNPSISIFNAKFKPLITLKDYLGRLKERTQCSCSSMILALVYIDKYACSKDLPLTLLNIHRLYLTGLILASKFIDDVYFDNKIFAAAGGVSLQELNVMELQFFETLGFNIMFEIKLFQQYQNLVFEFQS